MSRLVVQIPCYNEEGTIRETLRDLPGNIAGVDETIVLVVDDGSTDNTVRVALESGADYVVLHRRNRGLARAFMTGLTAALAFGADVIVNTDADNQYPGRYIPELVAPILGNRADISIGDRQPATNVHFSGAKRLFERLGSWRMQVYSDYSYTLETLVQAGKDGMSIAHIPIETHPSLRPSRLHRGILHFMWRQSSTIIRSYTLYQPLKSFLSLGLPFLLAGTFLIIRFLYFYVLGETGIGRYAQSVSIGGTMAMFGLLLILLGLLADAVRANRAMMQETLIRLRESSRQQPSTPSEIDGSPVIAKDNWRNEKDPP
jgi:glycosyltransferase involved in cell wall biosynthesis